MLTACCAATFCATASPSSVFDEPISFAGAEICTPARINLPTALKNTSVKNTPATADPPIQVEADDIESVSDTTLILRGNAEVVQGNRGIYAERIVFNRDTYRAKAHGDVVLYTTNGDEIRAATLDIEVDTYIGAASDVRIRLADDAVFRADQSAPDLRARANAQTVHFNGGDFQQLYNVTMTTCAEGDISEAHVSEDDATTSKADVLLSAKEIKLNHATGVGTAKSMTVRFKNTPIFYFPTATFPLNDARKTGFLFPSVGYDNDSGTLLETPYYLNIAAQMDATLTPRILSARGAQLAGEFRYLAANGNGNVRGEFLPNDNEYAAQDRYAFGYRHHHQFGDNWRAMLDWQSISDDDYLRDFANEVAVVASSYIPSRATLDYFGETMRFSAHAEVHESVDAEIMREDRPYMSVPQLSWQLKPQKLGLFYGGVDVQYSNFQHDDSNEVHGTRLRVNPFISLPLEKSYGYIKPSVSFQTIRYSLDNYFDSDGMPLAGKPSVEIPIYSVDAGLFFERPLKYGGALHSQTLEPRLFYVRIPEKQEQRYFPDFDTHAGSDSSFAHFFRENRFFGGDRVGDTEQIVIGATSRIIDQASGKQSLKLSMGQVFYLQYRKINTTDSKPKTETENSSGFFGEVVANAGQWQLTAFARLRHNQNQLDTVRFAAQYQSDHQNRRRNASVAYTYRREIPAVDKPATDDSPDNDRPEQINLAFQTPLADRLQLQLDGAYSLRQSNTQSSAIGIRYDGCCWAMRIAAGRYLDGAGEHKNRLMFTLELADLGRISSRL